MVSLNAIKRMERAVVRINNEILECKQKMDNATTGQDYIIAMYDIEEKQNTIKEYNDWLYREKNNFDDLPEMIR